MGLSKKEQNKLFTAGYFTKGVLYLLIGGFAMATVIGSQTSANGPKAVLDWIADNPFGQVLLFLTATGLAAYAVWRWFTAVGDTEAAGTDAKGIVKRVGYAASGTGYGLLSFYAFKKLFGSGGGGGTSQQDMVAILLEQSYGQWLVGILAVIVAGTGVYQLYRGVTDKHMDNIEGQRLDDEVEDAFRYTGRIGLIARFIVFGVIAYFLLRAAQTANAGKFRGMAEAIESLRGADYGSALVLLVGLGMLAYGLFMMVRARYETV